MPHSAGNRKVDGEVAVGDPGPAQRRRRSCCRGSRSSLTGIVVVDLAVGLAGVHVLAVGKRRGQQRAEEAVEGGERLGRVLDEAEVALGVVADRELVVRARLEEAVHLAAVELGAAALPGVVGIGMPAALEVRRQPVRRHRLAAAVPRRRGRPGGRRRPAASRGSGRRSGSPSSARRTCRSGMLRGLGMARRRWRLAASATSVSGSSTVPSPAPRPAVSAVRARNSLALRYSSGASKASRSAMTGSRMSSMRRLRYPRRPLACVGSGETRSVRLRGHRRAQARPKSPRARPSSWPPRRPSRSAGTPRTSSSGPP